MSDDLSHHSLRTLACVSIACKLDYNLMSVHGAHGIFNPYIDIGIKPCIIGNNETKAFIGFLIGSDYTVVSPLNNLYYFSLSMLSVLGFSWQNESFDGITVIGIQAVSLRYKQIVLSSVNLNKTKTLHGA